MRESHTGTSGALLWDRRMMIRRPELDSNPTYAMPLYMLKSNLFHLKCVTMSSGGGASYRVYLNMY